MRISQYNNFKPVYRGWETCSLLKPCVFLVSFCEYSTPEDLTLPGKSERVHIQGGTLGSLTLLYTSGKGQPILPYYTPGRMPTIHQGDALLYSRKGGDTHLPIHLPYTTLGIPTLPLYPPLPWCIPRTVVREEALGSKKQNSLGEERETF